MITNDTASLNIEAQLRDSIRQTERLGFHATAEAMQAVLAELLRSNMRADTAS